MAPCLCHRLSCRISCAEPPHGLIGKLRGLVILSRAFFDHHTALLAISELTITTCSAGVLYPSSFRWTLSGAHMEPPRCCRLLQGLNTLMCLSPKLKSFRFLLHFCTASSGLCLKCSSLKFGMWSGLSQPGLLRSA